MSRSLKAFLVVTFCVFLLGQVSEDKDNPITVSVDKQEVETGEVFTYKIKVNGEFTQPKVTLPRFKDFKLASQSHSKSYSVGNTKTAVKINLVFYLFATEPGTFTIEPVVLKSAEGRYESKAITINAKGEALKDKRKILPYLKRGTNL